MEKILRPAKFDEDPSSPQATAAWQYWERTFNNFIATAAVPDDQKLNVLINFVGLRVYEIISEAQTFDAAIKLLKNCYIKPKNTVFARHLLATCKQDSGESLEQFVQKLQCLAKDCDFKPVTAEQYRDNSVREAFISGIASSVIRQRLLEQKDLDLKTAVELARSLEMAEQQNQSFKPVYSAAASASFDSTHNKTIPDEVYDEKPSLAFTQSQSKCFFCGQSRHPRSACPAKDAICKKCSKKGHFAKVCLSKKPNTSAAMMTNSSHNPKLAAIGSSTIASLSNATVTVKVNRHNTRALIDTGSTESFISENIVKKRALTVRPGSSQISMATGDLTKETKGFVLVDLEFKGSCYRNIKLSILPNLCSEIILGHDFLGLHSSIQIPMNGQRSPLSLCAVAAANIEPPSLFGELTEGWKPVATKSRRHNKPNNDFIEQEIGRLLREGIIEESNSPWRAQVLVTSSENHKRRMVVDYSQTINRFTQLDAYPQKRVDDLIEKVSQYSLFSTFDLKSAYHQVPIKEEEKKFTAFEAAGNLYQFTRIPFGVTNGVAVFQRVIDTIIKIENLQATMAYVDNVTICGDTEEEHNANVEAFLRAADKYNLTFNHHQSILKAKEISLLGYLVSKGQIKPDPERLRPLKELPPPKDKKSQERLVGMFAYYSQWIPHFSDKAHPLIHNEKFPLPQSVLECFESLKQELEKAVLVTYNHKEPISLVVETDASDVAIAATLNQNGRPLAFFTRTLKASEKTHPPVEREACAVIEALRKWKHYLIGTHFTLVTDNEPIAFMYGKHTKKVKNDKILRWRLELSDFSFDSVYRPGSQNQAADALSRCASTHSLEHLRKLHEALCHPGVSRFYHFVRAKNLPFSIDEVKSITRNCPSCAETKPRFAKPQSENLIKATQPFERLSIDFKGPLPSSSRNKYILTVIDEFSRFPFAFPCPDVSANTVIQCLTQLFCIFGLAGRIHSDRGAAFMSKEVKTFLQNKGVATSRTTPYNPQGNGQVERLNGTLWRAITLYLKSENLPVTNWEMALPQALHSIRSLLCTATNATPHERLFSYNRKSETGTTLPSWLTSPGSTVLMRRNVRQSKYEPLVEEVTLVESNPQYALIRRQDGKEATVSIRQLAPSGSSLDEEPVTNEGQLEEAPPPNAQTSDPTPFPHFPPPLPQSDSDQHADNSINEVNDVENTLVFTDNTEPIPKDSQKEPVPPLQQSQGFHEIKEKQGRVRPYNLRSRNV